MKYYNLHLWKLKSFVFWVFFLEKEGGIGGGGGWMFDGVKEGDMLKGRRGDVECY